MSALVPSWLKSIAGTRKGRSRPKKPQPRRTSRPMLEALEDRLTPTPVVTTVTPNVASTLGGRTIEIDGSGFTGATEVDFGSTAATNLAVVNDGVITVTAPAAAASGSVDVTVVTPTETSATSPADTFTYVDPVLALVPTSGSTQSTTVNTPFGSSLVATLTDQYGVPVSGATVTFTAPGTGASAVFPSGSTVTTDSSGLATEPITANTVSGSYDISASTAGVGAPITFTSLTNQSDVAAFITATSGNNQSTTVNTSFTSPLKATVTDQYGNPVSGVTVTFTAPATGA